MTARDLDEATFRAMGMSASGPIATPPPPAPALLGMVGGMKPVRTRVPLRMLLLVAAATCVFPLCALVVLPMRVDLKALPAAWVAGVGAVWLAGFVVPLALAILPPRGHVLPSAGRAGRAAFLAAATLVLVGLLLTIDAPGVTILPKTRWDGFSHLWWHCVSFSLKISVPALFVGALALRKVAVVKTWRLGAALGAAGGAAAGLTLHVLCPFGGAAHVGLAHGGGVVIGAALGALWLPLLARLPRAGSRGGL